MLKKKIMLGLGAVTCTLLGMGSAQAAVTATFSQVGNNVQVVWSGTYDVPTPNETFFLSSGPQGLSGFGTPSSLQMYLAGIASTDDSNAVVVGGQIFIIPGIAEIEGTYTGSSFGFDLQGSSPLTHGAIILPKNFAGNTLYSPVGTMTFENKTLEGIFGATLPGIQLAFRGAGSVNGSREIFIAAVPEPSSALLFSIFAAVPFFVRRRAAL